MNPETEKKIRRAIIRIEKGKVKIISCDRKLSIASVAEEAGIHHSTIINRYPILAALIKDKSGRKAKSVFNKEQRIVDLERKLHEANSEITSLKKQLSKAISLQANKFV